MSKHAPKAAPESRAAEPMSRAALATAARVIVGAILIYSGAMKAAAPAEEFAVVIEMYDVLPSGSAVTAATFLPWVEVLVGWALVLGWATRAAAGAALAMLATFVLAILSTKARGIDLPNCGCFGGGFRPTPAVTLAIDLALCALAFFALKRGPGALSLDNPPGRPHT